MCVKVCVFVFEYMTMVKNILGYQHALFEWEQGRRREVGIKEIKGEGEIKLDLKILGAYVNLSCSCSFEYIHLYVKRNNRDKKADAEFAQ